MNLYLKPIYQYFDFSKRTSRKEFWIFTLVNILISWIFSFSDLISGTYFFTIISFVFSLFIFIPSLAVTIRRLHDIGKSGWFLLIGIIPIVGWVWILVLLCMEGENGVNNWGRNPEGKGNISAIELIGKE